jgi:hypothetical protein
MVEWGKVQHGKLAMYSIWEEWVKGKPKETMQITSNSIIVGR